MGEVALLQYHHGVLEMHTTEVYSYGDPCQRPATTPLNWAVPRTRPCQEFHPVSHGLVTPYLLFYLLYCNSLCHAVMGLSVNIQWTPSQVFTALRAAVTLPLSLLVVPAPPPSSGGYRLHLTIPLPTGIDGIPYPIFLVHSSSTPPNKITPSACQMRSVATPGCWRLPSCCLRIIILPAPLTKYSLLLYPIVHLYVPWSFISLDWLIHHHCCCPCRHHHPLPQPGIPSDGPLCPPPRRICW